VGRAASAAAYRLPLAGLLQSQAEVGKKARLAGDIALASGDPNRLAGLQAQLGVRDLAL